MRRIDDWRCSGCGKVSEFLTRDFSPPETPCSCGTVEWVRLIPGPATNFKAAGRYIPPKGRAKPV